MSSVIKRTLEDDYSNLVSPHYLAHCAIAPLGNSVSEAMRNEIQHFGAYALKDYGRIATQRSDTKTILARLFGGTAANYAFIPNTSFGINQIAHAIQWRNGDRIVLFEHEFPTNIRPWLNVAQRNELMVHWLSINPTDQKEVINLERLEAILKKGVRLVSMSAVQFQSGVRMPIEEVSRLCKQYDALFCVDAIQACGSMPFDGTNLDFWVCGGHKWMLGPEGTGFLYINEKRLPSLSPAFLGWLSLEDPLNFLFDGPGKLEYHRPLASTANRFELGTHNTIGLAGLKQACLNLEQLGFQHVFTTIQDYHDKIELRLIDLGFQSLRSPILERRSGILSVKPPSGCALQTFVAAATQAGVVVTAPEGHLRIAPHFWNSTSQIDSVVDVFRSILS
ncbi:MAG: aminotransferase class V-fold PLP-dependent enzyme [Bradymonadia bacterium]